MPADLGGERAGGLWMHAQAVCGRHDERHHRIAVRLGDRIDRGGGGPRDRLDPDDARRGGAGSQYLQAGEQARGEVIVAAGRHDDHLGISRHSGGDRRSADADLHGELAFVKERAQTLGDRIANDGTCCRRRGGRLDEQEGECRGEEDAHGPKRGVFPAAYRIVGPCGTMMLRRCAGI
jgi:hypothetical protein